MVTTCIKKQLIILFISLSWFGCQQQPPATPEKLPHPGQHSQLTDKMVRPILDKSPMDMIYFPIDYPILKMSGKATALPVARVIYSRPAKDGRQIFGGLVQYNQRWRLGANEATEIEFFTDVSIQGKKVSKGRYIIYCIPFPDKWTIILNNDLFVWGLKIHASKDAYSFDIPVQKLDRNYEVFTMDFAQDKDGMMLEMAWDDVKAILPINF